MKVADGAFIARDTSGRQLRGLDLKCAPIGRSLLSRRHYSGRIALDVDLGGSSDHGHSQRFPAE